MIFQIKFSVFSIVVLSIAMIACNKGNNSPGTAPSKPDTAYLPKTILTYFYDATGTVVQDSTITKYTYDDQRRISTGISIYYSGNTDTTLYTYASGRKTGSRVTYNSSVLIETSKSIDYFNSSGRIDSNITTGITTNALIGKPPVPFTNSTYYHYDGYGNDILDSNFSAPNRTALNTINQRTYSGNMLSSVSTFLGLGMKSQKSIFQDGNMISDTVYDQFNTEQVLVVYNYTYLPTLSGGYDNGGNKNLTASMLVTPSQGPASTQIYSYIFDSVNRVSTVRTTRAGLLLLKISYTY